MSGCTAPWGLPDATTRLVTHQGIAGAWRYDGGTLQLNPDATFALQGSDHLNGTGTWRIESADKEVTLAFDNQAQELIIGYVIDLPDGNFGIFGGEDVDPDFWFRLERVESAK